MKHVSELVHPRGKEAEGFILQFNYDWLRLLLVYLLGTSARPSHRPRAVGAGNGMKGESKKPQCEDTGCSLLHLVWPGQLLRQLSLLQGGGDLFVCLQWAEGQKT